MYRRPDTTKLVLYLWHGSGVEQAMENWDGKTFLQLHQLFQFAPTYWGHMPFFVTPPS